MTTKDIRNIKGITLLELLLSITIFSVIMAAVYGVLRWGIRSYHFTRKNLALQEELEEIVNTLVSDLQECRYLIKVSSSSISFWNSRGQKITYFSSNNVLFRNNLPLNNDGFLLSSVKFSYFTREFPIELLGEEQDTRRLSEITLIEFTVSLTDGTNSMDISSAVSLPNR